MSYNTNKMYIKRDIRTDILRDWISKEELFKKADSKILHECGSLIRSKFGIKYYQDLEKMVNSKSRVKPEKNEVKPKKRDILMDIYNNKITSEELINLAPKEALKYELFIRNKFGNDCFEKMKKKIEENSNVKSQNLKPQKRDILMDIYNNKITPEELIELAPKEALEYELFIRNKFGNDCFEKIKSKINKNNSVIEEVNEESKSEQFDDNEDCIEEVEENSIDEDSSKEDKISERLFYNNISKEELMEKANYYIITKHKELVIDNFGMDFYKELIKKVMQKFFGKK